MLSEPRVSLAANREHWYAELPISYEDSQPLARITIKEYYRVHMRIILILFFVYIPIHEESKSTTLCVLLNMSKMSTSNFKYEQYK